MGQPQVHPARADCRVQAALAANHRDASVANRKNLGEEMTVVKKLTPLVCLLLVSAILVGCSALNKAGSNSDKPAFDLSGSWEVVATSNSPAHTGAVSYVEFNVTQQGNGNISAPVQEFILVNRSTSALGNCFGAVPGSPQGNITATVGVDNIQGTFTETGSTGSAPFSINAPLSSATTFSGNYSPMQSTGIIPGGCIDAGSYVATKAAPLAGTYTGTLTYPDGSVETMSLTATQDSAYNLTVTGTASGGNSDGPINLTGKVTGNLAQLNNSTNTLPLFAWWDASTNHKLYIIDNNSYLYGSLGRQ